MDIHRSDFDDSLVGGREDHHHEVNRDIDRKSTPADFGTRNAQACITACYDQFVDDWEKKIQGGFDEVCNQLSHGQPSTELWKLYCCDSTSCGVWISEVGQSPSVDLIINKCQGIGNFLIYDPGPPSSNVCSIAGKSNPGESGLQSSLTSSSPSAMMTSTISSSSAAVETSPSSELNSTVSGAGVVPSTSIGLTEGSKAAIGICSSLAIIAIIFLVGFLISRRRSSPKGYSDSAPNAPRLGRSSSEPPSGSRTPLITPPPSASSKGPPLTPPARLSDRRFLPSLLKQGGTPNSSLASGMDERPFLPPTLTAPSDKKLAPRHERRATTDSITQPPLSPSHPAAVHFAPYFLRDSGSSYSSGPGGASTATIGSNKPSSVRSGTATIHGTNTPPILLPLSPTRPARPHDGPLEIPNLVKPAGPPPNRALPAPPPYHPASPTFTVSPVSPSNSPAPSPAHPLALADSGHAFNAAHLGRAEDKKHTPESSAIGIALPASTQDLCDLAESYARETSESWGSWNGAGGGAPGVTVAGPRKRGHGFNGRSRDNVDGGGGAGNRKGGRGSSVSLQELDLEKLGGKY
ncbi:hypothetical protein F4677DRAFT_159322 [Hypoxylon crocopeplum]|nr:hypothetical protein F4677DRAFT_159322 [Hypoxylon crocopeplum]